LLLAGNLELAGILAQILDGVLELLDRQMPLVLESA
jgi:hypothetical protein